MIPQMKSAMMTIQKHIYREGETGRALNPQLGRLVSITYRVVAELNTPEGWVVRDALLGVCDETGEGVVVPPQSAPAFKAARLAFEAAGAPERVRA
jgi:hypothetical protein